MIGKYGQGGTINTTVRILLLSLCILFGCSTGPPVKNPQFKEASLPSAYRIEGVAPIRADAPSGQYATCVDMVLNFYGRKEPDTTAKAKGLGAATIIFVTAPIGYNLSAAPDAYKETLKMHGFKTYTLYDLTQNAMRIKYFLAQNYPIIMMYGPTILLTGYDDSRGIFFLCNPKWGEAMEITYEEFLKSFPMVKAWADESKTMRVGTIIYPAK